MLGTLTAKKDFFSTVAQVLPVLFLVLLVGELSLFQARSLQTKGAGLAQITGCAALLLGGEVVALRVLATGNPTQLATYLVAGTLALAFALLLAVLVLRVPPYHPNMSMERRRRFAIPAALVVAGGTYFAITI